MRTGRFWAISTLLLATACAFASASPTRYAEALDVWKGWAFLMGDWVGSGAGPVHEDLLIVYPAPSGPGFRAIYFDNEGHTIPYRVAMSPTGPSLVFESEGVAGEPRFRLSYEGAAGGAL